jgi:hypothetical protein
LSQGGGGQAAAFFLRFGIFIGHFALGYAAKRWAPGLSLAALLAAAQFADLLWPVLVALGVERVRIVPGITEATPLEFISYPYSHSLLALLLWGTALGWISMRALNDRRVFAVVLALVVSHWVLDVITHIPDMPLYPGGPKVGLGLWNSIAATRIVEVAMFAFGVSIYVRATAARDAVGRWAFWALTAFLLAGFLAGGPPPPSVTALWVVASMMFGLTLTWAWWVDRHRAVVSGGNEKGKAKKE